MTRRSCTADGCKKYKNLDADGFCPNHKSDDSVTEDNSECSKCKTDVGDDDEGIQCDLCLNWYHLKCTDLTTDSYKCFTDDTVIGIKWFCEKCVHKIENLISQIQTSQNNNVVPPHDGIKNNAKDPASSSSISAARIPTCENYRHGTCLHGISGKKVVDDKMCPFRHPRKCIRYCRFGSGNSKGCSNFECKFFHPILCRNSVKEGICLKDDCTYTHLVGTRRTMRNPVNYPDYGFPLHNESRYQYRYPGNSNYNHTGMQREKYTVKNTQARAKVYNDSSNFHYHESDFPKLDVETPVQMKHTGTGYDLHKNSSNTGLGLNQQDLAPRQNFLDLAQAIYSLQTFQQSLQHELSSIKTLLPQLHVQPQAYPTPQAPVPPNYMPYHSIRATLPVTNLENRRHPIPDQIQSSS